MYVLKEENHIILVDPCVIEVGDIVGESIIDYIILTHEHYDHISGVNYWKNITGAKVICSKECSRGLSDPHINLSSTFQQFCAIQSVRDIDLSVIENVEYVCRADIIYDEHYTLEWEGNTLEFFTLPGHSKGSTGILINNEVLFAGDSLLKDYPVTGCFIGSSGDDWTNISLPKLKKLPSNVWVYPGHFERFNLQDYRFWNESKFRRGRKK